MEPSSGGQQLILAKVYKWFNGVSPYSQYCGGIRKPMCVCTASCTEGDGVSFRTANGSMELVHIVSIVAA